MFVPAGTGRMGLHMPMPRKSSDSRYLDSHAWACDDAMSTVLTELVDGIRSDANVSRRDPQSDAKPVSQAR